MLSNLFIVYDLGFRVWGLLRFGQFKKLKAAKYPLALFPLWPKWIIIVLMMIMMMMMRGARWRLKLIGPAIEGRHWGQQKAF